MIQPVTNESETRKEIAIIQADTRGIRVMQAILTVRWREQQQRLIERIDALAETLRQKRDANSADTNPTL